MRQDNFKYQSYNYTLKHLNLNNKIQFYLIKKIEYELFKFKCFSKINT
jgi:hypothetical protein